ncbi:MAG: 30S ribosomal protein S8 [Patescibacteria group bacterium]
MDTIAEMLTKIRNAQGAEHASVWVRFSNVKLALAKILEKEGFVELVERETDGKAEIIRIKLKYYPASGNKKLPAIQGISRVSKLGKRVYVGKKEIQKVKNNFGISIISTSKGLMTGEESKKAGLGGEYVCQVW